MPGTSSATIATLVRWSMSRTLSDDDVRAVAAAVLRVVLPAIQETLAGPPKRRMMKASQVADYLAVSLDFVYAHKAELGGIPLSPTGKEKRPRWRFHPDRVDDMKAALEEEATGQQSPSRASRAPSLPGYTRTGAPLLPIQDAV